MPVPLLVQMSATVATLPWTRGNGYGNTLPKGKRGKGSTVSPQPNEGRLAIIEEPCCDGIGDDVPLENCARGEAEI